MLDEAFGAGVHVYALNFLKILCGKSALGMAAGCLPAYKALLYEARGILPVQAVSAVPLDEAQRRASVSYTHLVVCMKIKAAVFDIDGTLVPYGSPGPGQAAVQALRELSLIHIFFEYGDKSTPPEAAIPKRLTYVCPEYNPAA